MASLFVSLKKTKLFCTSVDFLGHRISEAGIEADNSKVKRILDWPKPRTANDVQSFLGLIWYLAVFLLGLATFTRVLTLLTKKDAEKAFPAWMAEHQGAFDSIKELVTGRECLTTIDHDNLSDKKIFVTCDASDWRTGAVLSWGVDWQTARQVAFESVQLREAKLNYLVHEKELLAVVRTLKKWCVELLGSHFEVWTDHRTLENFLTQRDLSRRQARWQEFLGQYNFKIKYVKCEDNTVADALSRLPPDDVQDVEAHAVLRVSPDEELIDKVRTGYQNNKFCTDILGGAVLPGVQVKG